MPEKRSLAHSALGKYVTYHMRVIIYACLCILTLSTALIADTTFYEVLPFSQGFELPQVSVHTSEAEQLLRMIPPDASVSAQNKFVSHLSERDHIYLFPYQDDRAEYILLDTTGDMYPLASSAYAQEVQKILHIGHYHVLVAENGYLLLQRVLTVACVSRIISACLIGKDGKAVFS